jgi:hypothetical protein
LPKRRPRLLATTEQAIFLNGSTRSVSVLSASKHEFLGKVARAGCKTVFLLVVEVADVRRWKTL